MATEKTYEMLWDCKYCGTPKLLGLTHRHCPSCGAPQDATGRYFPSDAERVAVEDHVFSGADLKCPSCGEANGARAKHCRHCGGPLAGAGHVAVRADPSDAVAQVVGDPATAVRHEFAADPSSPKPAAPVQQRRRLVGGLLGCGCLGVLLALIAALALYLLWKRDASAAVIGHSWTRSIAIERYSRETDTAWCDSVPAGARELSRQRTERTTRDVPDGEDCRTRKQDQGDGTFKEVQECQPRFKKEPVFDDRCTYEVLKWTKVRAAEANGQSITESPRWPDPALTRPGTDEGCEREGARTESYVVRLREASNGAEHSCTLPENRWAAMKVGSRWTAKVHQLNGALDCGTLAPAE